MKAPGYSVILLDLGGVLWNIGGGEHFLRKLGSRLSRAEELEFWSRSGWLERMDTGTCTPNEFASSLMRSVSTSAITISPGSIHGCCR